MSVKKRVLQIAVFLVIMFLTFYALFSGPGPVGDRPGASAHVALVSDPVRRTGRFLCLCGRFYDLVSAPFHEVTEGRTQGKFPDPLHPVFFYRVLYSGITPSAHRRGNRSSFTI